MTARRTLPLITDNPPPTDAGGALYVPPTPGNQGRTCGNCALYRWAEDDRNNTCRIHEPDLTIGYGQVCGYHLYGEPTGPESDRGLHFEQLVTPQISGLITAPRGGTSCGNCRFFAPFSEHAFSGACLRVAAEITDAGWRPAEVDMFGCCTQWAGRP